MNLKCIPILLLTSCAVDPATYEVSGVGIDMLQKAAQAAPVTRFGVNTVGEKLLSLFPNCRGDIHLEDVAYEAVSIEMLKEVSAVAWKPWVPEKWDCDDQSVAALFYLRSGRYRSRNFIHPPAAGRLNGSVGEFKLHSILWCMEANGNVRFWDQTVGIERFINEIDPWRLYDK